VVLFLGGKNPLNLRWTNKKKGNIGKSIGIEY
jgi:ribosomal protein L24E